MVNGEKWGAKLKLGAMPTCCNFDMLLFLSFKLSVFLVVYPE